LIRVNPDISMETMASFLGLTRKGVEWQVRKLKQAGILRRTGPDKGGHWEIAHAINREIEPDALYQ
jgi:ATP-dependent DNA helicase RecG